MSVLQPRLTRTFLATTFLATVSLVALAGLASAQTSNTVTLQTDDKTVTITGELIEMSDGNYRLNTLGGIMTVAAENVTCSGSACPPIAPKLQLFEQDAGVTLTSLDGAITFEGKITAIEDEHYIVQGDTFGSVRIRTDLVSCAGPGCPTAPEIGAPVVAMAAPATEAQVDTPVAAMAAAAATAQMDTPVAAKATAATAAQVDTSVAVMATPATVPLVDTSTARIHFVGSGTVGLGLMPYLLDDYAGYLKARAETTVMSESETFVRYVGADTAEVSSILVNSTVSDDAFSALEARSAEIGMTSRAIAEHESRRLFGIAARDLRNSEYETVVAVDSIAVITNPINPVRELSMAQIGEMYSGRITNWSQVGGLDAPITLLSRKEGSGTRAVFDNAVFSGSAPALAAHVIYPDGDNAGMAEAVDKDPYAIGYVAFAFADGLNHIGLTSDCGITSTASAFSVKTEEYPFSRRLYLYNRPNNTPPDAQRFLEYALSSEADDAIAESGFVNFAVERIEQSASRYDNLFNGLATRSERSLAYQLRDDLNLWDRLSTTVRFPTGSITLGRKELNDIERLVAYLQGLPNGTRVAVVGFADSVGPFENNEYLSRRRALSVADAIAVVAGQRTDHIMFETRGYGELSPSVCDTDEHGRSINRRVEIWVHK